MDFNNQGGGENAYPTTGPEDSYGSSSDDTAERNGVSAGMAVLISLGCVLLALAALFVSTLRRRPVLIDDGLRTTVSRFLSLGIPQERLAEIILTQILLRKGSEQLARYKNSPPRADTRVIIGISELHADDPIDPLLHEDALLSSWQQFINALSDVSQSDRGYIHLTLNGVRLNKRVSDMLLLSFESAPLTCLSLLGANVESNGIRFLVDSLRMNATLEAMCYEGDIDSRNDAMSLIDAVVKHPKCDMLILDECGLGGSNSILIAIIVPALNNLKQVSLERNGIGSFGAKLISACIACNPSIEVLLLDGNLLKDRDAVLLANSLKSNTRLRALHLSDNYFTQFGMFALHKAVLDLSSLNAVYDSNHTCYLGLGKDQSSRINSLIDSKMNRKVKLKAILSPHEGCWSVIYLDDVSIKIIPSVLYYLQKEISMDAVFQLIREWCMPLLYTNHIRSSAAQTKYALPIKMKCGLCQNISNNFRYVRKAK